MSAFSDDRTVQLRLVLRHRDEPPRAFAVMTFMRGRHDGERPHDYDDYREAVTDRCKTMLGRAIVEFYSTVLDITENPL